MPVPSNPQDLINIIREKLFNNTSGLIEEPDLREVLENIVKVLDAKFSMFSPNLTEEQYAQWNMILDYMAKETKGVLSPTSPAPTEKGKYLLSTPGTYTNLGGLVASSGKLNYAYFDGTTWSLVAVDIGDTANPAKLPLYSAIKSANIIAGTQFIDDENGNIVYRVKTGQTLLTTDAPANVVGTKVEQVGFKPSKTFDSANDILAPTMKGVADYMPLYEVGKNKLNKHTFVADRVLNPSGGHETSASWSTTGFLEIPPNTEISIKEARFFAQYDANKNFISGTFNNNTSLGNITLTTNANTRFFRMTTFDTRVNLAMVEIGSSVTAYEDYKVTVVKRKYDNAPLKFAPLMNETAAADLEPFTLQSRLRDYILGESFTISSATYTDGIINSPISVNYPDGATGTLTITRNANMAVTKIVATHIKGSVTTSVTINITRNSDNNVTLITIQ